MASQKNPLAKKSKNIFQKIWIKFKATYPQIGLITIFGFLLVSVVLLIQCARGVYDISNYRIYSIFKLKCGCDSVQNNTASKFQALIEIKENEKRDLGNSLSILKAKIDQIDEELSRSNFANTSLINQRNKLEKEMELLKLKLLEKDSSLFALSEQLRTANYNGKSAVNDAVLTLKYEQRIDSILNAFKSVQLRNSILEAVYIRNITVNRVDDSHIVVSYTLMGIDTLMKYYPNEEQKLLLKVFDEEKQTYLEMVERNPKTNESKHATSSCLIKYSNANSKEYIDVCHFINTQDKPFSRGFFGLKQRRFTYLFYLPGYDRPLSYYPTSLKKRRN
jgi:hypothetical protein